MSFASKDNNEKYEDNNNNVNFLDKIKNFDKSKLNHVKKNNKKEIEIKEDIEEELEKLDENDKCIGKREKKYKTIEEQLQEFDNFLNEYKKKNKYKEKKEYICQECDFSADKEIDYQEHLIKHLNEQENNVCVCNKCGQIFENNEYYLLHKYDCIKKSKNKDTPRTNTKFMIQNDLNGKYECPVCRQKFSNSFILGEHFFIDHNDYTVLCSLDVNRIRNGFPGFNILKRINMIDENKIIQDTYCKICYFEFNKEKFDLECLDNNRNSLTMTCCNMTLCCDCLMNYIIASESIICPYCRKDHTQRDIDYIIFIDEITDTNREVWEAWWINHLEIFD